jgi:hypothetical protein
VVRAAACSELALATGSRARLPSIRCSTTTKSRHVRDLAEGERSIDLAEPGTRCAVPRGGLPAARLPAAKPRSVRMTLLHPVSRPGASGCG